MKKQIPVFLVIIVIAVVLSIFYRDKEPPLPKLPKDLKRLIISSPPITLPKFTLVDENHKPFTNNNLMGKWSMLFFGYTNCPDVCPTTMAVMNQVSQLADTPKDTQYVFISVDPKRDTPDHLKQFTTYFNPTFMGVTGKRKELDKFRDPIGAIYSYEGDTNSDNYVVNHFSGIYFIDPKGRERAYVLPPHSKTILSKAYQLIRNYYD